jgi:hypothetical protein
MFLPLVNKYIARRTTSLVGSIDASYALVLSAKLVKTFFEHHLRAGLLTPLAEKDMQLAPEVVVTMIHQTMAQTITTTTTTTTVTAKPQIHGDGDVRKDGQPTAEVSEKHGDQDSGTKQRRKAAMENDDNVKTVTQ